MQVSNLMKIIVSAIIGVVVFAAILVPVTEEATTTEKTFDNAEAAMGYMTYIGPDTESYTLVFDGTNNPGYATVNGEDVPLYNGTILGAMDEGLIRNVNPEGTSVGVVLSDYQTNNVTSFSLTIDNGVCSYIVGTNAERTLDISNGGFALVKSGEYVMTSSTQDIYLNSDSEIYALGLTNVTGAVWNTLIQIEGDVEDVEISSLYSGTATVTFGNVSINANEVDGYEDLYDLDSITFNAVVDENTTACTYNRIIIPAEVTAELSVHPGTSEIALLNIIPLLVLVGLVLGVVGAVLSRRD